MGRGTNVIREFSCNLAFSMGLVIFQMMIAPEVSAKELKVLSEQTATGFGHVESVAYDPKGKVLYTSDFGPESSYASGITSKKTAASMKPAPSPSR